MSLFRNSEKLVAPLILCSIASSLFSIFISSVLFGLAVLFWLVDCLQGRQLSLRFPPFSPILFLFIALTIISICFSEDPGQSSRHLKKLLRFLPVFLLFTYVKPNQILVTMKWIFFLAGASAGWGVLQYYWLREIDLMNRISGFMSHWMTFSGQIMIVGLALAGYLVFFHGKSSFKRRSVGYLVILTLVIWAVLLSYTRSAWIGLLGGTLLMLVFFRIRWAVIVAVCSLVLFFLLPASFQNRLYSSFDFSDTTTQGRVLLLKTGIRIAADHPWFGVGPRMVEKTAQRYRIENEMPDHLYQHLHNNLSHIAVERGIPAAIVWCLLWLKILFDGLRFFFRRKEDRLLRFLSINAICIVTAFQLMGLFEYNFGDAEVFLLLFFFVTIPYVAADHRISKSHSLQIAILGTRGIPANYGGFETFAEALSTRLVQKGHSVTVYCRNHYVDAGISSYNGVRLRRLPAIRHKYFDTISHTAISALDTLFRQADIVLICNAANAFLSWIPQLTGKKVVVNVDGIERLRKKWNWMGKGFYWINEIMATVLPDRVVTDAKTIQNYYQNRYRYPSRFIPYGASTEKVESTRQIQKLGLREGAYFLYVSRFEPENNAHRVLEAYLDSKLEIPLALVGDAPYSGPYIRTLKELASKGNVIMPGAIYGTGYRELLSHCLCYLHGTEVGGTHPALIEAMGAGALVIVHATEENLEVVSNTGLICSFENRNELTDLMKRAAHDPERFDDLRVAARRRVEKYYNWDQVTKQYEGLFHALL